MIICSWNINSIRIRIHLIERLIQELKPDVIKLQEIKCLENEFPDFYKKLDYNVIINGEKGKYGVAILIKKNIKFEPLTFDSKIMKDQARICGVMLKENNLALINIYTPNGNPVTDDRKFNYKIEWMNNLLSISKNYVNKYKNLIIGGDFNVIEHEDDVLEFDKWKNDALGHFQVRSKFREFLTNGFTNVSRLFYPPGSNFSFWDYQRSAWERNDGLLIDHFLVTPSVVQKIKSINFLNAFRGLSKPSDHIPFWIEFDG